MKQYHNLEIDTIWQELLLRLEDDDIVLLNRSNKDFVIGWEATDRLIIPAEQYTSKELQNFIDNHPNEFIFGNLSYDIKNDETRHSIPSKEASYHENDAYLLVTKHVLIRSNETLLYFGTKSKKEAQSMIEALLVKASKPNIPGSIHLTESTPEKDYIENIKGIKEKIQNGIIYEMNYCVQFKNTFKNFSPEHTYIKLAKNSEAPFAAFIRFNGNYILSASPERFITKKDTTLISQPIKGTARRGETPELDKEIIDRLIIDPKEIAENVMIVDLVRNDLSKIANKKSVEVTELCKVYSFKTVHQLISTIIGQINPSINFSTIIKALYPMGSMTGAPKISAMQNIDAFESFNRGMYSGAIGYIEPNGNFDFNVVIRTIMANLQRKEISCSVGGAITIKSDPLAEYNECKLKLNAIQQTLC